VRRFLERFRPKRKPDGPEARPPLAPSAAPLGTDLGADATTQLHTSSAGAVLGCIVVESGPESMRGKRFVIHNRETRVGRANGCDIALRDPRVSREHIALVPEGSELWLVHRSTTNPTFVNGQAVRDRVALHDGDRIQLAEEILLRLESPLLPRRSGGAAPRSLPQAMEDRIELEARIERDFVRDGSFLDVDVVDSYGLKSDTTPERVVVSFERFRSYVDQCVTAQRGRVLNSAGDEVMAFFARADDALEAGRTILCGLADFNQRQNVLKRPFRARIGIDSGRCAVDLTRGVAYSPILDTAGHLQKAAPTGAILLSDATYQALSTRPADLERVAAASKQVMPAWLYRPCPPEE
jgi:class 3 adenylate cyclase